MLKTLSESPPPVARSLASGQLALTQPTCAPPVLSTAPSMLQKFRLTDNEFSCEPRVELAPSTAAGPRPPRYLPQRRGPAYADLTTADGGARLLQLEVRWSPVTEALTQCSSDL